MMDIVKRSNRNRDRVRMQALDALMQWYRIVMKLTIDDDLTLVELCDEKMPDGSIRWFIEPPAPGVPQLNVIEKSFGNDNWQIYTEIEKTIIRSHGGL